MKVERRMYNRGHEMITPICENQPYLVEAKVLFVIQTVQAVLQTVLYAKHVRISNVSRSL